MPIDANILLRGNVASIEPAANRLMRSFGTPAERENRRQVSEMNEQRLQQGRNEQSLFQLSDMQAEASMVQKALEDGNTAAAQKIIGSRVERLKRDGRDTRHSEALLQQLSSGDVEGASNEINRVLVAGNQMLPGNQAKVGAQKIFPNGTVVQSMSGGGSRTFLGDNTEVFGEEALQAQIDANKAELQQRQDIADIDIDKAARTEQVKQAAKRDSDFITKISTRNRDAARDQRKLEEALILSSKSGAGITASAKVKLSKILPGIDVDDESMLDAALNQLALDQLERFPGTTTDFEFNIAKSIAGSVSNSKEARAAKLNSLKRAAWFNKREYDQFIKHQRAGGSSDNFSFNFGEQVKTKKGVYTLQDLQDTAVANNISIEDVLAKLNAK